MRFCFPWLPTIRNDQCGIETQVRDRDNRNEFKTQDTDGWPPRQTRSWGFVVLFWSHPGLSDSYTVASFSHKSPVWLPRLRSLKPKFMLPAGIPECRYTGELHGIFRGHLGGR